MLCTLFCLFELGVCWVYPLMQTVTGLQNRKYETQWIAFWMIVGLLSYIELNLIFFVATFCVYDVIKSLFVLWLVHPDFLGATYLHEKYFTLAYDQASQILKKTPFSSIVSD